MFLFVLGMGTKTTHGVSLYLYPVSLGTERGVKCPAKKPMRAF